MKINTNDSQIRSHTYLEKFRFLTYQLIASILTLIFLGGANQAKAVPTFARQTGQSCVACHAGGQFPELTPYGRIFKLTGYTIGSQGNPFSAMLIADVTQNKNNIDSTGSTISQLNNVPIIDYGSVFVAGKITDNIGGFSQFTYNVYDSIDSNKNWRGHLSSDNTDVRYTNRFLTSANDLILGVTVHNSPGVQDVWNSSSAWGYPYVAPSGSTAGFNGLPVSTVLDGSLGAKFAGIGGYAYWNKSIYVELTGYETASGFWRVFNLGNKAGNLNYPITYSDGISPYLRVAYTHDWNEQNVMVGLIAMNTNIYPTDPNTGFPILGATTHYQDKGIDAQYQYLLDPHTVSAHFRYVRENINDDTGGIYATSAHTSSTFTKITYTYRNQYGVDLAYKSITGSPDSQAYIGNGTNTYTGSANNSPNTRLWTPEVFWLPMQNLRIGLQYNLYTEYLGATTNYDGNGRNATDNNSAYLYAWMAF
jgi:hypothetical protein